VGERGTMHVVSAIVETLYVGQLVARQPLQASAHNGLTGPSRAGVVRFRDRLPQGQSLPQM
jgi:hypothetical protein